MAIFKRHLTLFGAALLVILVLPSRSKGQTEAVAPVTFRTLAVGNAAAVTGLFYESQGKSVRLPADGMSLSAPYPSPPTGLIALYRELPPLKPGGPPQRVPVAEAQLGKNGPYLLVLTSEADPTIAGATRVKALPISDSWDTHPVESLRIFNFSRRRAAIQINTETVELATTQSHVSPFPKNARIFELKVAILGTEKWMLASSNPPALIPHTRLIIVITDMAPTPYNPHPVEVDINAVYDDRPPQEPKQPVSLAQTARNSAK